MRIQLYTMTHKHFNLPTTESMYQPLQVGRAGKEDLGYLCDNTGDNISELNYCFSELTGVYWIWKNVQDVEYVGVCHYRRYLIQEQNQLYTEAQILQVLQKYDIITSKRLQYDRSYYEEYASAHNAADLRMAGQVLREKYPEDYPVFERLVHGKESYFGNICVAAKPLFDQYAAWLFDILLEVKNRICIDDYDAYHKRVFGFISEFLLLVWVEARGLKAYEGMVGMTEEKHETAVMKARLAEYLSAKDVYGAKNYFMDCVKQRPDVLLEASDITGELRLSMQAITTCEHELTQGMEPVCNRITDWEELMTYFRTLNSIAEQFVKDRNVHLQPEQHQWLMDTPISEMALRIAVMVMCKEKNRIEEVVAAVKAAV